MRCGSIDVVYYAMMDLPFIFIRAFDNDYTKILNFHAEFVCIKIDLLASDSLLPMCACACERYKMKIYMRFI